MGVHEDDGSASGAPPPPPPPQPAATSATPATSSPSAASKLFFEVKPFLLTSDDRLAPGRSGAPQVSVVSLCCATGIRRRQPAISASGKERRCRGGTRKFCRRVVCSTELKPCPAARGWNSRTVPSGITPSMASRTRLKSSVEGLKTTKWTPAAGTSECEPSALQKNGLSSVLKSARCGIAVPCAYTAPSGPT